MKQRTFRRFILPLLLALGVAPAGAARAAEATAVLAGGCFWCMEADFEKLDGVLDVVSGFTGGSHPAPTYNGRHDGHYEAVVELVTLADQKIVSRGSAECGGPDETMWQRRTPHARRSMAATRATGKAARLAFSWIVKLAGYEPTPAEEMPAPSAHPDTVTAADVVMAEPGDDVVRIHFGKNRGKPVTELSPRQLEWYIENVEKKDATDSHHKPNMGDRQLAAACRAELDSRQAGGGADEIPF